MTEPPSRRRSHSSDEQPLMGDHPELETDEIPRTDPLAPDRGGRSSLLVPGIVLFIVVLVVVIVALVLFFV